MALPSGRTTNFFGDLTKTIYDNFERNAADVVNSIHKALLDGTPRDTGTGTPVDTGALKANWHAGAFPNTNVIDRPTDGITKIPQPELNTKLYGIHRQYYIWNNSPYLEYVNAGIAGKAGITTKSSINIGFVKKAMDIGIKVAMTHSKIRAQKFF